MLSNNAFNALLKTLEEPPAHVKFIFATTEIRKVPITILSRCQRFDLRRLDENEIASHLKNILQKEELSADDAALQVIAKMSEGSVRDSLSLLDQALASNNHEKLLPLAVVEKMLGLSNRSQVIDLFEKILEGDFVASTKIFDDFYALSSDCSQLLNDLLEVVHKTMSVKLIKDYKLDGYSQSQQEKLREIVAKVSLNSLLRIWQISMKSVIEINSFSSPKMAFEVLLAKLCYLVALPNLQNILIDLHQKQDVEQNVVAQKTGENNDDLIHEILRNFEGAKINSN